MVRPEPTGNDDLNHAALGALVESFYSRVRRDPVLGDMFNAAIAEGEWPAHLARLTDFWSSVMLTSGRYHGNPMAAHLKHRDAITPRMFSRWLELWAETARAALPSRDAEAIVAKAHRIAESLQLALYYRPPSRAPKVA